MECPRCWRPLQTLHNDGLADKVCRQCNSLWTIEIIMRLTPEQRSRIRSEHLESITFRTKPDIEANRKVDLPARGLEKWMKSV